MLHEAVRFLPTGKGVSIIQNFGEKEVDDEGDIEAPPDVNELFPMIRDQEENWQAKRVKVLEGSTE